MSKPRIALVCDWLTTPGGAEKVLLQLHRMYPTAPIYTSQYSKKGINWFDDADVRTGWLQIFPRGLRKILGPLRQLYFSHLDLSAYDIVISVTGAEAKAVQTKVPKKHKKNTLSSNYSTHSDKSQYNNAHDGAFHVCYCHVPTQYYWQFYDQYLQNPGFGWLNPVVRFFFKIFVRPLRKADFRASQQPDQFITISHYAAAQIKKYYHREAQVIAPPVDVEKFSSEFSTAFSTQNGQKSTDITEKSTNNSTGKTHFSTKSHELSTCATEISTDSLSFSTVHPKNSTTFSTKNSKFSTETEYFSTSFPQIFHRKGSKLLPNFDYYVISCRQVTWKRVDLAIQACLETGNHLVVIGDGPEHHRLVRLAESCSSSLKQTPSSLTSIQKSQPLTDDETHLKASSRSAASPLITFIPWLSAGELAQFLRLARAYIFPSLEPFGIAPVEALAAGCPVVAYAEGGSQDFIQPTVNGITFPQQNVKSLAQALREFKNHQFNTKKVAYTAKKFSAENFEQAIRDVVSSALSNRNQQNQEREL